jgi:hypothetical protein
MPRAPSCYPCGLLRGLDPVTAPPLYPVFWFNSLHPSQHQKPTRRLLSFHYSRLPIPGPARALPEAPKYLSHIQALHHLPSCGRQSPLNMTSTIQNIASALPSLGRARLLINSADDVVIVSAVRTPITKVSGHCIPSSGHDRPGSHA